MTQFTDLDADLGAATLDPAAVAAVLRLIATQPDADTLADALGVTQ